MKRFFSILLIIFCLLSFSGCQRKEKLDIPDDVTDVRLTIQYEDEFTKKVTKDYMEQRGEEIQFLRVYYGYCSNGEWYDHPFEHYDLIEILSTEVRYPESDCTIGSKNHMVKIGPYLLITIKTTGAPNSFIGNQAKEIVSISDTIDSKVEKHFAEYYSPYIEKEDRKEGKYALFMKKADAVSYVSTFGEWYTILLEYDKIPKDYVLTVVSKNRKDKIDEFILTYDDIQKLLA